MGSWWIRLHPPHAAQGERSTFAKPLTPQPALFGPRPGANVSGTSSVPEEGGRDPCGAVPEVF